MLAVMVYHWLMYKKELEQTVEELELKTEQTDLTIDKMGVRTVG